MVGIVGAWARNRNALPKLRDFRVSNNGLEAAASTAQPWLRSDLPNDPKIVSTAQDGRPVKVSAGIESQRRLGEFTIRPGE